MERIVVRLNRWTLILLLWAMSCIIFANVVLRYTTGDSIVWAEEVARYIMIWITFLGAGLVLRFGGHVAIDNLHRSVGLRWSKILRVLVAAGVAIFCVAMIYFSIHYVWATRFQTTAVTNIPIAWVYAVMPAGFALTLVHLLFVVCRYVSEGRYIDSEEINTESAALL